MKYEDIRPTLKSGDVIAWSHGGWKTIPDIETSIVRMFTQSEYSHVGVVYIAGNRVFIVEAVVPEIRIFPLSKLRPFTYIRTPFEWTQKAEETLLGRVGLKYSKWDAIKAFFKKDKDPEGDWECAMLVNWTMQEFDPDFINVLDTPTATVKYLQQKHDCPLIYVE